MTKKKSSAALIKKLAYWRDYNGTGDEYRRTHDLDCVLTGGNLNADTIISLWLPLRYTMNHFDKPRWQRWRDFEYAELRPSRRLKDHSPFLDDMIENLDLFLDLEDELTQKLLLLFDLGQKRCNVMLLPKRSWNSLRGGKHYEYLPSFLFDLFSYAQDEKALQSWLHKESLEPFFANEILSQKSILDLAGTGSPCRHNPRDIQLDRLLDNYIAILRRRAELLALRSA